MVSGLRLLLGFVIVGLAIGLLFLGVEALGFPSWLIDTPLLTLLMLLAIGAAAFLLWRLWPKSPR